jgi:hypothetical protein
MLSGISLIMSAGGTVAELFEKQALAFGSPRYQAVGIRAQDASPRRGEAVERFRARVME